MFNLDFDSYLDQVNNMSEYKSFVPVPVKEEEWVDEEIQITDQELVSDIVEDSNKVAIQLQDLINSGLASSDKDKMFAVVEAQAALEKLVKVLSK